MLMVYAVCFKPMEDQTGSSAEEFKVSLLFFEREFHHYADYQSIQLLDIIGSTYITIAVKRRFFICF